jgi:GT2 family glycosyltransferase
MIYTHIPYTPNDKGTDLGYAYNKFMEILPDDDDWGCFLDHDAMFTTHDWYNQLGEIIKCNPDIGIFGARTNRILPSHQLVGNIDINNHDIKYHRVIGLHLQKKWKTDVFVLDSNKTHDIGFSGVVILIKKSVWEKIGGFKKEGFLGVDDEVRYRADECDQKIAIMNGVYVYHWYREGKPLGSWTGGRKLRKIAKKWFSKGKQKESFDVKHTFLFGNSIYEHLS